MIDTTALRSCTMERASHRFCGRPSLPDAPFPICAHHAILAFRFVADQADSVDPISRIAFALDELDQARARRFRTESAVDAGESVVYYLLIDGLVKIGSAANLNKRLAAYPPTAEVLATEPGGRDLEMSRHAEFSEYLSARREWFTPGPRLRVHIESLADYRAA